MKWVFSGLVDILINEDFFDFFARNEKSCIFASVIKALPFFLKWTWPSEDGFICL